MSGSMLTKTGSRRNRRRRSARRTANFAATSHVRALQGDGTKVIFEPADLIYVSAGATQPRGRLQAGNFSNPPAPPGRSARGIGTRKTVNTD
jgi:hypothetical protein